MEAFVKKLLGILLFKIRAFKKSLILSMSKGEAKKRFGKKAILALISLFTLSCQAKHIIFDLGYTLVKPDKTKLTNEMSIGDFTMYMFFDGGNPDTLLEKVFDVLSLIAGSQETSLEDIVYSDSDLPMPQVMVEWQLGSRDPHDILEDALLFADELKEFGYFASAREYRLVKQALRIMLEPDILAGNIKPIKKGLKLLRECAQEVDEHGNPLHELYILSNWDPASFDLLQESEKLEELFSYFKPENIFVSGKINKIKPHKNSYEYVLSKIKAQHPDAKPEDCIFIDDRAENIEAAKKCKIRAIHLDNKNYKKVREALKEELEIKL